MPSSERQPFVFGRTAILIAGLVLVPTAVPASAATAKGGSVGTMTRTAGTVVVDGKVKFEPMAQKYQIASVGWAYGPALVDLDNDGFLDLYATAGFVSQDRTEPDG